MPRISAAVLSVAACSLLLSGCAPVYETVSYTVIDTGGVDGRGPELCEGLVSQSRPPQCFGTPIEGWEWDAVDHQQSAADPAVRWGDFAMKVERLDGGRVRVDMASVEGGG